MLQLVLTRWAVPVFLMISGVLLLEPSKRVAWKDVWRYERRMILVLITFGYLFCLMEEYVAIRCVGLRLFRESLLNLLSGKSWSHLWYLYALMGIYLLLPVFRSYVASATREDQRTFLIVLFVFTVLVSSVNEIFGTELKTFVWLPCYVFYFLLGHYAFRWVSLDARLAVICVVLTIAGCVVQVSYVLGGSYGAWVRGPASPFVTALSLLVFLSFKRWLDRPYKPNGVVALLSSYSLGIYVLHPLFLNVAYKALGLGPWSMPPVIFEVGMWSFAFFGSVAMMWVLRKIPGVRRIM